MESRRIFREGGQVKSYKHTILRSGLLGSDEVQFGRQKPNYHLMLSNVYPQDRTSRFLRRGRIYQTILYPETIILIIIAVRISNLTKYSPFLWSSYSRRKSSKM
jgi:hypothetical protein